MEKFTRFLIISVILIFAGMLYLDTQAKLQQTVMEINEEIEKCKIHFRQNHCHDPVPIAEIQCMQWKICAEQDALEIASVRLFKTSALAHIANEILSPLSFKFLVLISIFILILFHK